MSSFYIKLVFTLSILAFLPITNAQTKGECLFDPCQTANYCKNFATCVMNSTECSAYCVCREGFTGIQCEVLESTTTTSATSDVSNECLVDPCFEQPNSLTCKNGGSCIRHLEKCDFTCTCADGYTGRTCEAKNSPNIPGSFCNTSGFLCLNGECLLLNDSINGDETVTEICQCDSEWTGKQCDVRIILRNETTVITMLFNNDTDESEATTASQYRQYNACSTDYMYRPTIERTCDGILSEDKCVLGLCRKERLEGESWSGYSYFCECDGGAKGEFCDHLCCKDCGEHGTCAVDMDPIFESSTEHCLCDNDWTGDRCNTNKLATSKATVKSTSIVNVTVTPTPIKDRFNACSVHYIERPKMEKTCNGRLWEQCTFGKCRQEWVNETNWVGNSYVCDCDYGAQGAYCDYKCCLDCGDHGQCAIVEHPNSTLSEHCDCKPNYVGEHCETFVPEPVQIQLQENTWYLYVVGACAVVFVVLIILAVVVPYMMWKHRVILIMKIVHYFKAYEDDDERQWDAFVSYKADEVDEHFVVHTLFPKLETELGFKLCLHFRDFVPGETIANNIINAVEGSRRTILILTPRYVESEFTRFEYEKAQQEMLRRKHRIIPLVLEDISDVTATMDITLRNIIESVTYLEWPHVTNDGHVTSKKEEKFWKRLHLSMPKKKEPLSSNGASSSKKATSGMTISSAAVSNVCSVNLSILDESGKISRDPLIVSEQHMLRQFSTESSVSSCCGRSYSCSGESCSTLYSELSDVDAPRYGVETDVYDVIPTFSEEQEAGLHSEV